MIVPCSRPLLPLCISCLPCPDTGKAALLLEESVLVMAVTQPGLGLGKEMPATRFLCVFVRTAHPPTHCPLPAVGQEPPLGEEVQSVSNWAIFITAVSGLGEGKGAEAQPLQLALQTRTCSAESSSPSRLEQEPRRLGPQPPPACPLLACCLAFQIRSKGGSPLFFTSFSLLQLSGWIWGGQMRIGPGTTIPR